METLEVLGIDAAYANMGFAHAFIRYEGQRVLSVHCQRLTLVSTGVTEDKKRVRKSSIELRRASELHQALHDNCAGRRVAFVEVPSGSQSAGAARCLGITVGVLASCPIPLIQVNAQEVKQVVKPGARGKGSMPTKTEMIAWASARWPNAPGWLRHGRDGKTFKKGDLQQANEHLADALATIIAGTNTTEFRLLLNSLSSLRAQAAPFVPAPVTPARKRLRGV